MRIAALHIDIPNDPASVVPHAASLGAIGATIVGWLPTIVLIIPALYYAILIYESKTVQKWLRRRRLRRSAKRRARIEAARKAHKKQ